MYTLYHLKGNKWGMTHRTLEERFSDKDYKSKGLTVNDVCETETYSDEHTAADRERELNIRDGYGWNISQDYRIITKRSRNGGLNTPHHRFSDMGKSAKYTLRKLDYEIAQYIRNQYATGKYTQKRIGQCFGVSQNSIMRILKNKTYTTP
jgi:hypothetical protein